MVFPSSDPPGSKPLKQAPVVKKPHVILVPVFLRVTIAAADDLEAEVHAVEAVRAIGKCEIHPTGATFEVASVIHPVCEKHPHPHPHH